jgi:2-hydroxychromene-2-carboxylate isomerase
MNKIEFWFEFASTYSYPAAMRIEELAQQRGVQIEWRPFLLGPIFKAQGWNDSPFNLYPEKGRYMWRDLERTCEKLALPFKRPSQFPRNGLLAARIACWFDQEPWMPEFVRRVYTANFAEDCNISDPSILSSILESIGQLPELITQTESLEAKEKLRHQTERAIDLGTFGAPSFTCGEELFWGNDRLEEALGWARQHTS